MKKPGILEEWNNGRLGETDKKNGKTSFIVEFFLTHHSIIPLFHHSMFLNFAILSKFIKTFHNGS